MYISAINNQNFNGKFKNNETLSKLMLNSDKATLTRFNEILDRAEKVNDHIIYSFKEFKINDVSHRIFRKQNIFQLMARNTVQDFYYPIDSFEITTIVSKENPRNFNSNMKNFLSKFFPELEKIYPVIYEKSDKEILQEINKKLI